MAMSPVRIGGAFVGVGTTYKHPLFPYTTYILVTILDGKSPQLERV